MAATGNSHALGPLRYLLFLFTIFLAFVTVSAKGEDGHEHSHATRQMDAHAQAGKQRWNELHQQYLANLRSSLEPHGKCTWENMVVRKEWGDMSVIEKKAYFSALHCLKGKPVQTDQNHFPGAQNRWDDFVVGHLINVRQVHRSPWLAVWHRHYEWRLERALREECGYAGGLPYWHWSRYLHLDVNTWPLFDNSETSISGNGTQTGPRCACVEHGPFANWTINLGPAGEDSWGCKRNPRPDGRGYNPSCLERTFQPSYLENVTYRDVVYTIDNASDANQFASLLELEHPMTHNMPHLFMGGTQVDVTFSSQEIWFHYHHAMVDFVFSIWQSLDFEARTNHLPDSHIYDETRSHGWGLPTPVVDLDSEIYISDVFGNITAREAMWTTRNHYCYRYE